MLCARPVRFLADEDEFLYLATHAANHAFLRGSWLVDLQRYLLLTSLDWAIMGARARAAGVHTAVSVTLVLHGRALGVELPARARRAFATTRFRRPVYEGLFSPRRVPSAELSSHRLGSFCLRLAIVDSPAHGVRHLREGAQRRVRRSWRKT